MHILNLIDFRQNFYDTVFNFHRLLKFLNYSYCNGFNAYFKSNRFSAKFL